MMNSFNRIVIVGTSGVGKSTLALQLHQALSYSLIDMDDHYFLPNWQKRPTQDFIQRIQTNIQAKQWIVAGNYSEVRQILWPKADLIIWLDYPLHRIMTQLLKRTIKRVFLKQKVCGQNFETFTKSFMSRESILLWALNTFSERRKEYPLLLNSLVQDHQRVERLTHPKQTQAFLEELLTRKESRIKAYDH